MKIFATKLLRNYAIMVIFTILLHRFIAGNETLDISLLIAFLAVLFVAELFELPINKFASDFRYPILGHLLKVISAVAVFLVAAIIFGTREVFVLLFIAAGVTTAYAIECFLDFRKASQDIAYINEQLKQRRDKNKK